jgi:CheY-like chemotaxis protein
LVVDDEPDVHKITKIALRRRKWKGKPIELTSATSARQAREILSSPTAPNFHTALVDVVMETEHAGLELCEFIRANLPPSVRIVLRTGQAGLAPEEAVLNQYDIDYYLSKSEVTEQRLYATIRACLRGSQDIAAVMAMANHLRTLTSALRDRDTSLPGLFSLMGKTFDFLEEKYAVKLIFIHASEDGYVCSDTTDPRANAGFAAAIKRATEKRLPPMKLHEGPALGLAPEHWVVLSSQLDVVEKEGGGKIGRWFSKIFEGERPPPEAGATDGVIVNFGNPNVPHEEFLRDLELFTTNLQLVLDLFILRRDPSGGVTQAFT